MKNNKSIRFATILLLSWLQLLLATVTTYADPGGWEELPNTTLNAQCPEDGFNGASNPINGDPMYDFPFFCQNVTAAWSGAALDTTRNQLYIWGGGHMNYLGNEIYALNLNSVPTMSRLTDPGLLEYETTLPQEHLSELPVLVNNELIYNGTQPKSRETYDGMVYLPIPDKLWAWSGSLAIFGFPDGVTWLFDPSLNHWQRQTPTGEIPFATIGAVSSYDPNTGSIYLHNMQNLFRYTYNASGGNFEMLTMFEPGFIIHMNGVIDPKRNKFILIGPGSNGQGQTIMYDIGTSNFIFETVNAGGDTGFLGVEAPGLAYDPMLEKVVAWAGGDTVYVLDLDTNPPTWTAESFPVQPPLATEAPQAHIQGTYGRFEYVPALKAFVLYNATDKNGYLFRWPDTDDDGVIDKIDNCIEIANIDQRDTDSDGYGNICDADFNNNGVVDPLDFSLLKAGFGSTTEPDLDLNGNGIVDPFDFSTLKASFGKAPGPSAFSP